MSCGASGAMNAVLKTILDPGEEVVASVPCFMEYASYVDNHGGALVLAPSRPDFDLDVDAIEGRITPRTAAVIVNSPNNPTGRIYPEKTLRRLAGDAPGRGRERWGRPIYLLSDEPYRKLAYGGAKVPGIMRLYPHSIVVTSYSKDLSLPGERIGFAAVNPEADDAKNSWTAIILCTRILGYVNAPALMQRVICSPAGRLGGRGDLPAQARPVLRRARGDGVRVRRARGGVLHLPKGAGRGRPRVCRRCRRSLSSSSPGGVRPARVLPHRLLRGHSRDRALAPGIPAGSSEGAGSLTPPEPRTPFRDANRKARRKNAVAVRTIAAPETTSR